MKRCKICNVIIYKYSIHCKKCYIDLLRIRSTKHGKYTISKCIKCNGPVSRQAQKHICRTCLKLEPKTKWKYFCKICNKKIAWHAKLCKKHYILTGKVFYKGKNHFNYKGNKWLKTRICLLKKYKMWRRKCFKRDNYTCQICGKTHTYLEVHHKIPFLHILELYQIKNIITAIKCRFLWDINNGISLCKSCHNKVHPEKGYYFIKEIK